jgi:hypothetical protein
VHVRGVGKGGGGVWLCCLCSPTVHVPSSAAAPRGLPARHQDGSCRLKRLPVAERFGGEIRTPHRGGSGGDSCARGDRRQVSQQGAPCSRGRARGEVLPWRR